LKNDFKSKSLFAKSLKSQKSLFTSVTGLMLVSHHGYSYWFAHSSAVSRV